MATIPTRSRWSGARRIAWFLDGVPYHEVTTADMAPNAWVFDQPFFLLVNVAVGGNFGGPVAARD